MAIDVRWDFTAQSYFDQLPPEMRSDIAAAIDRVSMGDRSRVRVIEAGMSELRMNEDYRIVFTQKGNVITILDVISKRQVDALQRLSKRALDKR